MEIFAILFLAFAATDFSAALPLDDARCGSKTVIGDGIAITKGDCAQTCAFFDGDCPGYRCDCFTQFRGYCFFNVEETEDDAENDLCDYTFVDAEAAVIFARSLERASKQKTSKGGARETRKMIKGSLEDKNKGEVKSNLGQRYMNGDYNSTEGDMASEHHDSNHTSGDLFAWAFPKYDNQTAECEGCSCPGHANHTAESNIWIFSVHDNHTECMDCSCPGHANHTAESNLGWLLPGHNNYTAEGMGCSCPGHNHTAESNLGWLLPGHNNYTAEGANCSCSGHYNYTAEGNLGWLWGDDNHTAESNLGWLWGDDNHTAEGNFGWLCSGDDNHTAEGNFGWLCSGDDNHTSKGNLGWLLDDGNKETEVKRDEAGTEVNEEDLDKVTDVTKTKHKHTKFKKNVLKALENLWAKEHSTEGINTEGIDRIGEAIADYHTGASTDEKHTDPGDVLTT